jgi:DNA-binding PadR family transcriptional regulator
MQMMTGNFKTLPEITEITDEIAEQLILSGIAATGELSEDAATKILEWADQVTIDYALLKLAAYGYIYIKVTPEGEIAFSLTEKGKGVVSEILAQNLFGGISKTKSHEQ